jgi:hypothetical protein
MNIGRLAMGAGLGAVVALGSPALARAGTGPPGPQPPAETLSLIRDMTLTVQARRRLSEDDRLAPCNLSVKVNGGTATLWGPVPSAAEARRAVKLVEQVRGIVTVRNELFVQPAESAPEVRFLPSPKGGPTRRAAASPDRETGSLSALTSRLLQEQPRPRPRRGPGEGLPPRVRPTVKPTPVVAAPQGARLLPPVAVGRQRGKPPAAPVPRAGDVGAAVQRVRAREARFQTMRLEVRGGTVELWPGEASGEDVMALAQALRRVHGVKGVVVRGE